ncbi:flowering-promoting factor 1-like [Mangifera indica]|uniref:flowering-promoting factor 1-like n=1 Tax=Mangifera indica TaxID=29780 RepID=UPI001CFBF9A7|nr:flowering-promoting factor 1-like [Mangifera indica]
MYINLLISKDMSGVWLPQAGSSSRGRKVLVYLSTGEVVSSYSSLEKMLNGLGWEKYEGNLDLFQFHKHSSVDLISLPRDFCRFNSTCIYMYDIVVKNPNIFHVRDM